MKANLVLSLSVALAMVFAYASFVKAPQIIDTDFSGGTASGVVISSGSLQLQPPSASWWDTSWNYRMRLDVTPVSYDRKRATIGPFSVSFPPSCQGCALDENSLRIVQKGAFCDQSGSCKPNLNDWVKEDLLSGLTEFQKTGNTSSFTQLGIAKNVDFSGNPIDIAGVIYSSGILQVPNSGAGGEAAVTYKMNRQYSRFRATLGLDYSTDQAQADMNCAVLVDSASVAGRPLDMLADTLNIDIDVTGKDELTLECDNADSSNAGDWAVWGNARLSRWTNTTPVTEDPGREISLGIPPVKSYGDTLIYNDFEKSANTWFKRTSGSAAAASQDSQGSRGSSKSLKVVMTQSDGPRNNNLLEDQAGDYYTDDFPYIIFDYQMPTTARAA
ncbi:MAG: NPCBM/NEW2 domain-containing protein, partial [Candidatus Aenigmarchaeota archaeon]|nr:NPCBM/NEW2 domain-containing protein [Candidatus Aenigmarchaeota archaeon]